MKINETILDKHLIFNFKFLEKCKKVNFHFLERIKSVSNYSIRQLKQNSRQQTGYGVIDAETTNLPKLNTKVISYLKDEFNIEKQIDIRKYDYLRVGPKERLYGLLVNNIFLAILYDKDKKMQA